MDRIHETVKAALQAEHLFQVASAPEPVPPAPELPSEPENLAEKEFDTAEKYFSLEERLGIIRDLIFDELRFKFNSKMLATGGVGERMLREIISEDFYKKRGSKSVRYLALPGMAWADPLSTLPTDITGKFWGPENTVTLENPPIITVGKYHCVEGKPGHIWKYSKDKHPYLFSTHAATIVMAQTNDALYMAEINGGYPEKQVAATLQYFSQEGVEPQDIVVLLKQEPNGAQNLHSRSKTHDHLPSFIQAGVDPNKIYPYSFDPNRPHQDLQLTLICADGFRSWPFDTDGRNGSVDFRSDAEDRAIGQAFAASAT